MEARILTIRALQEILSLIEDDYLDIEYSTPDGDSASQGAVNLNMLAVIIVLLWY